MMQQQTALPMNCGIRLQVKEGKRTYRSSPKICKDCPCRAVCGANERGQRVLTMHIWQEYLDLVEQLRKTERGKQLYAMRKETIERVFADEKEKRAMRYTHHQGLARVSAWERLKYAITRQPPKWSGFLRLRKLHRAVHAPGPSYGSGQGIKSCLAASAG